MGETNSPSVAHVGYNISPLLRIKFNSLEWRNIVTHGQLKENLYIQCPSWLPRLRIKISEVHVTVSIRANFGQSILHSMYTIVLSIFMLTFIFAIVCGLFEWKRICADFFIVCFYLFWRWRPNYQEGDSWDSIIWFNPITIVCLS